MAGSGTKQENRLSGSGTNILKIGFFYIWSSLLDVHYCMLWRRLKVVDGLAELTMVGGGVFGGSGWILLISVACILAYSMIVTAALVLLVLSSIIAAATLVLLVLSSSNDRNESAAGGIEVPRNLSLRKMPGSTRVGDDHNSTSRASPRTRDRSS